VKKKPVKKLISFVVHGKITDQDGAPRPGLIVKASARNIGKNDELLGQAISNSEGNYFISFAVGKVDGNTATVNLIISVYQSAILLQSSDIIFSAAQQTTKDFVIPVTDEPQFEIIENEIKPLPRK
jgi:hypothetical protein